MSPERMEIINGQKIEEYSWGRKSVVCVNNYPVRGTFEETCKDVREGRKIKFEGVQGGEDEYR